MTLIRKKTLLLRGPPEKRLERPDKTSAETPSGLHVIMVGKARFPFGIGRRRLSGVSI